VTVPTALDTPVSRLVGPKSGKVLTDQLGIATGEDLLRHYPRRYYARGELTDLGSLRVGEQVTVQATVVSVGGRQIRPKLHKTDVTVTDGHSTLALTFFNQRFLEQKLRPGTSGLFSGTVSVFKRQRQLTNPEYDLEEDADAFAGALVPVYPATAKFSSPKVRKAVNLVLDLADSVPEPVPDAVLDRLGLMPVAEALRAIHRPADHDELRAARRRLRFEEAFVLQVVLARRRAEAAKLPAVARPGQPGGLLDAFDARLPFQLTRGQQEVCEQIEADLGREHPMQRLLQGEVGSGKTVVALRAMLRVVDSGGQAALLAPTEVLAQQHARSIAALLGPLAEHGMLGGAETGTRIALLTGSQSTSSRRRALLEIASGEAGIVVGTHALLEDKVDFFDLGLVVVDEQHRFGVEQRDALRAKAAVPPHVLVMTATPIPRTVAMTVFGDLDISTLTELPAGRADVTTHVVPVDEKPHFLDRVWARVREEVGQGRQAYVVCPRIGETGADAEEEAPPEHGLRLVPDYEEEPTLRPGAAVLEVARTLADGPLAGLRVETLHGRMAPDAKDDVMRRFAAGEVDVLVATTVVEVGVDVSTASAMVIMDADRFGISQLHQLRGRVGRGALAGICLLVTESPAGTPARERLDAVASTRDGFELSRADLSARREGDVLGASQSGRRSSLRMLSVIRDEDVIVEARTEAVRLVAEDPHLFASVGLRRAVDALLVDERADYLEKA
jgi:ATP-dependent DNA helicase RecG